MLPVRVFWITRTSLTMRGGTIFASNTFLSWVDVTGKEFEENGD